MIQHKLEDEIKFLLESFSKEDGDFWSFKNNATRENAHIYFQYPAMMVPRMQEHLIQVFKDKAPFLKNIFDPFVGSGTTMVEAMMQGLDFTGYDINPLAVLICRAKMGPFQETILCEKFLSVMNTVAADQSEEIEVSFPGRDKWFLPNVAKEISRIRRAIKLEDELWCRRFFWVILAETIRLTSNSRTSTFKLHIRKNEDISKREGHISPISLFKEIGDRNLRNLVKQKKVLEDRGFLRGGNYTGKVEVHLRDVRQILDYKELYDFLITSPPYGDNLTTVPYGQHSYLPLQWIDLKDIDPELDERWLSTTHEIDRRSLGGSLAEAMESIGELSSLSESFRSLIETLKAEPRDRCLRISAFYRDLNNSLDTILDAIRPGAYMIWIVGGRRVANHLVPIDLILTELLVARGVHLVTELQRKIPTKRMAIRNQTASTMGSESVLVLRKGSS